MRSQPIMSWGWRSRLRAGRIARYYCSISHNQGHRFEEDAMVTDRCCESEPSTTTFHSRMDQGESHETSFVYCRSLCPAPLRSQRVCSKLKLDYRLEPLAGELSDSPYGRQQCARIYQRCDRDGGVGREGSEQVERGDHDYD